MFHQMFNQEAGYSVADIPLRIVPDQKRSPILTILHHAMMTLGLVAIAALAVMFFKPELTDEFQAISPFFKEEIDADAAPQPSLATIATDTAAVHVATAEEYRMLGTAKQQQSVTNWLARRYHVSIDATNMLVSEAYLTAKDIQLDPLLILSVMAIESGLNPFAESPVGAQGLMQVMSKVHQEKFEDQGGLKAALNPVTNIRVGAQILKDYVTRGGSVEAGLKLYVGAALSDSDGGYGNRVLAEYRRLKDVANGKPVPYITAISTASPVKVQPVKAADKQLDQEHIAAI